MHQFEYLKVVVCPQAVSTPSLMVGVPSLSVAAGCYLLVSEVRRADTICCWPHIPPSPDQPHRSAHLLIPIWRHDLYNHRIILCICCAGAGLYGGICPLRPCATTHTALHSIQALSTCTFYCIYRIFIYFSDLEFFSSAPPDLCNVKYNNEPNFEFQNKR